MYSLLPLPDPMNKPFKCGIEGGSEREMGRKWRYLDHFLFRRTGFFFSSCKLALLLARGLGRGTYDETVCLSEWKIPKLSRRKPCFPSTLSFTFLCFNIFSRGLARLILINFSYCIYNSSLVYFDPSRNTNKVKSCLGVNNKLNFTLIYRSWLPSSNIPALTHFNESLSIPGDHFEVTAKVTV
jgi:hypothetical protein